MKSYYHLRMVAEPLGPNPPPLRSSLISRAMEADRGNNSVEGKSKGKGGKSDRMEPYESSDTTVETNSPIQERIIQRLRREHEPGDRQAPAVHSMATPTAQRPAPVAPPPGVAPQRGCTPDELYTFVMSQFKDIGKEVADMENRVVARIGITDKAVYDLTAKVDKLEPLQAHVNDIDVFAKIKNFTTQDALEKLSDKLDKDLDVMKGRLDGFVGQLEQYLITNGQNVERLRDIEAQFQHHVGNNFNVVEQECTAIRKIIDQVATGDKEAKVSADAAVQMQLGVLAENVRRLEAKETQGRFDSNTNHAEQVQINNNFWQEIGKTQAAVTALIGAGTGTGTGSGGQGAGNPGGGQGATSSASITAGGKCHCDHLELLKRRVAALEQGREGRGVDAWDDYRRRREPHEAGAGADTGAGGHGRGDHDAPRPRRDPPPNVSFPEMGVSDMSRVFDDKVALSAAYTYDGTTGGEQWRRKVRGYWVAKCPGLRPILDWAEAMDDTEITPEELADKATTNFWMTEVNVKRMDEVVWGFLNLALHGEAHTCFESAEILNGFEGWRLLCQHISCGQRNRRAALRQVVRNPPKIAKLENVSAGITKFDNIMKEYEACGGDLPSSYDLKQDLLDTLPQEVREQLLWRVAGPESFVQFKNHVRSTASSILFHRGKLPSPLCNVDHGHAKDEQGDEEFDEALNAECREAINAVMRRYGKGKGKGPKGAWLNTFNPRPLKGGGKGKGDVKCANCGDNHDRRACPKPEVPVDQRLCHGCGKPGHISRHCPDKQRALKAVDEAPVAPPETSQFGCIDYEDCPKSMADKAKMRIPPGYQLASKTCKPQPRGARLVDFMGTPLKNTFEALRDRDGGRASDRLASKIFINSDGMTTHLTDPRGRCGCSCKTAAGRLCGFAGEPPNGQAWLPQDDRRAETVHGDPLRTAGEISKMATKGDEPNANDSMKMNNEFLAPLEYADPEPEEILANTSRKMMYVAADTGAVDQCANPKDLPGSVPVEKNKEARNFIGASNEPIKNYGVSKVNLEQGDGPTIGSSFQVADVCRPLRSISKVCDNEHDVIFTKHVGIVVPAGVFDKVLATVKHVAKYPRRGGLYVGEFEAVDPNGDAGNEKPSGFARPGASR